MMLAAFPLLGCDPLAPNAPRVIIVTPTFKPTIPALALEPSATLVPTVEAIPPTQASDSTSNASDVMVQTVANDLSAATPAEPDCSTGVGQIVNLYFASKIARTDVKYRVYLPPCYTESTRRYPYVILMHGSDRDETEWTDLLNANTLLESGIAMKALPPMILVMPYGGVLANTNTFRDNGSWESLVLKELMPDVEKNFCTWNAREGRAIGGISRGGFWAFEIAFRHPELFSAVGGHSAFFDFNNAIAAYNPLSLAKTVEFAPGMQPRIYLDAGKDDYARPNIEVFQKTLATRNIDATYIMNPEGEHVLEYWAAHVTEYLTFYGQTWPRDVNELPSCLQ
jgi:enterochelin esterase-like enzyme